MTTTAFPPALIECETGDSHRVLEVARAAMPADAAQRYLRGHVVERISLRQRPLIPLLMALLDSAEAVAKAIDDNAWDEGRPVDKSLCEEIANQSYRVGAAITNACHAHDTSNWSLPSMSGKELV